MDYSDALDAVKYDGQKIARAGWNGKGMWVALSGHNGTGKIKAEDFCSPHAKQFAESQPNGEAEVLPCLIMKTADNKILMGWLASGTDQLADDWEIVLDA